ncbi:cupin domain-containing protein [Cesiribacter andamanensis]|uniref:Cupin type-2 domain-containing protein n=1 Tax=Cesiribacter andamanensis AMV16 TaxID=1279009 RepID=M7MYM0_9BACT|nr:cupin domain-containing protein [Cesiribacter andamanensis]EMR01553.1 hypothetical protein ADICEAN_03314 [Cesiribacter andamanensis AMV16]
MIVVDLNTHPLEADQAPQNPSQKGRTCFPLSWMQGARDCATVYFELDPGYEIGSHTDSAEEILLVMEGTVEATVGDESRRAEKGQLVLVPKMVPHNVKNIGNSTARILGFFGGSNAVVSSFEWGWGVDEIRVIDTATFG